MLNPNPCIFPERQIADASTAFHLNFFASPTRLIISRSGTNCRNRADPKCHNRCSASDPKSLWRISPRRHRTSSRAASITTAPSSLPGPSGTPESTRPGPAPLIFGDASSRAPPRSCQITTAALSRPCLRRSSRPGGPRKPTLSTSSPRLPPRAPCRSRPSSTRWSSGATSSPSTPLLIRICGGLRNGWHSQTRFTRTPILRPRRSDEAAGEDAAHVTPHAYKLLSRRLAVPILRLVK